MTTTISAYELVAAEFNPEFYAEEYADLRLPAEALLKHFCDVGWIEGRNPNPYFNVVDYLRQHRDVASANMNPLVHYLLSGRFEGRQVVPAASLLVRAKLLFSYSMNDWVAAMRDSVDPIYYLNHLPGASTPGLDPVAHFAFRGWMEDRNPSASLRIDWLRGAYPEAVKLLVNPL